MSHARETTLSFFVMYLPPLTSEVYLLVNLFSKLYITFILQWIAFIFGRGEEEDRISRHVAFKRDNSHFLCYILISLAGFQAGPTFLAIPTFPYFFLCSYFSLLFSENVLLSLLFSPKMFEVTKNCIFFPRLLEVCKNWIHLIRAVTMQRFIKYFYFSCNSFLSHLLLAGCDIGVRFSVRLSTFMSTFDIYVKVSILINY